MGIAFLVTAIAIRPSVTDVAVGLIRPTIPVNPGGGLLVLGLIGTTVVPYNLFLGSGISTGQSIREMRSGLLVAIVLGGIISMAVLVTGTAISGDFTFLALAGTLDPYLGGAGTIILGAGLFAAGFTSAVTAPLASAVTVRSLFGNILMTVVVFVSILIGMAGLIRAMAAGMGLAIGEGRMIFLGVVAAAVIIMVIVIYRISLLHK